MRRNLVQPARHACLDQVTLAQAAQHDLQAFTVRAVVKHNAPVSNLARLFCAVLGAVSCRLHIHAARG